MAGSRAFALFVLVVLLCAHASAGTSLLRKRRHKDAPAPSNDAAEGTPDPDAETNKLMVEKAEHDARCGADPQSCNLEKVQAEQKEKEQKEEEEYKEDHGGCDVGTVPNEALQEKIDEEAAEAIGKGEDPFEKKEEEAKAEEGQEGAESDAEKKEQEIDPAAAQEAATVTAMVGKVANDLATSQDPNLKKDQEEAIEATIKAAEGGGAGGAGGAAAGGEGGAAAGGEGGAAAGGAAGAAGGAEGGAAGGAEGGAEGGAGGSGGTGGSGGDASAGPENCPAGMVKMDNAAEILKTQKKALEQSGEQKGDDGVKLLSDEQLIGMDAQQKIAEGQAAASGAPVPENTMKDIVAQQEENRKLIAEGKTPEQSEAEKAAAAAAAADPEAADAAAKKKAADDAKAAFDQEEYLKLHPLPKKAKDGEDCDTLMEKCAKTRKSKRHARLKKKLKH